MPKDADNAKHVSKRSNPLHYVKSRGRTALIAAHKIDNDSFDEWKDVMGEDNGWPCDDAILVIPFKWTYSWDQRKVRQTKMSTLFAFCRHSLNQGKDIMGKMSMR
ncbi:unnamed protein product [Cylindrotheca closterium]|uniref:Uncharacterized protein n=1 Tax=Cylindrotheca closterium TaxID=2856 RepID=A0AAD2G9N6_9STRA|nr:unnamed protein product [Cylindrotheca closterium]